MPGDNLRKKLDEFEKFIWNHVEDPFQIKFDEARIVSEEIKNDLISLATDVDERNDEEIITGIKRGVQKFGIDYFEIILQFSGLTRSKIITDLKSIATSPEINIDVPSSYKYLPNSSVWDLSLKYLLKRFKKILIAIDSGTESGAKNIIRAINEATWPGWIRQERAKRSGHEAEGRLARILYELNLPFEPIEKAQNPLCRDVQIGEESFDIVIPSIRAQV